MTSEVRQAAYQAAAMAYCRQRFGYGSGYLSDQSRQAHIRQDAAGTAAEPWLRAAVDAALDIVFYGQVQQPPQDLDSLRGTLPPDEAAAFVRAAEEGQ